MKKLKEYMVNHLNIKELFTGYSQGYPNMFLFAIVFALLLIWFVVIGGIVALVLHFI